MGDRNLRRPEDEMGKKEDGKGSGRERKNEIKVRNGRRTPEKATIGKEDVRFRTGT